MSAAAFNIRWDRAQAAKESLGIEWPVNIIQMLSNDPAYAWNWVEPVSDNEHHIFIQRDLHPEFASFILWHELRHAWQIEQHWDGDSYGMLTDYQDAASWLGMEKSDDGYVIVDTNLKDRLYSLLPWEADANLAAWENRMTLLTKHGRGSWMHGEQGSWWYFRNLDLDLDEIIEIGTQYREGMRI